MFGAMNIVFYRPHANIWFRNTVGRILKRKLLPTKYALFLDYIQTTNAQVFLSPGLFFENSLTGVFFRLFDQFELFLWCLLNKISLRKIRFIFSSESLNDKDILFLMHYGNLTYETEEVASKGIQLAQHLSQTNIYRVVHLTHYAYCSKIGAENLAILNPDLLVAENNLSSNSRYFREFFGAVKSDFLTLPYVPAPRFQNRKPFDQRLPKLVVTGSITYKMKSQEFIDFFGANELQPMRRRLYEQAGEYTAEMDCLISDLDSSRQSQPKKRKGIFYSIWTSVFGTHAQQDYYKIDIVDVYNNYAMFAVPEEICDLPAIGFVEGMACGAAYFGVESPMYGDLGLLPSIHYVAYDGTVEDLMIKVRFYQENLDELQRIAESGCRFVREKLNPGVVYGGFVQALQGRIAELGDRQNGE